MRINQEIKGCFLAQFSTLKILQGRHFADFRTNFKAKLEKIFIVPSFTFDNVKGKFPIGFMIWDTSIEENFKEVNADIYNDKSEYIGNKNVIAYENTEFINEWIKPYRGNKKDPNLIGKFPFKGNDFQNQNIISIVHPDMIYNKAAGQFLINAENLIKASIYFAVRKCIPANWLNDRDQFLKPNDLWENDFDFQNDCLVYTLFTNNIQSKFGTNNWIPFTEKQVDAQARFDSNFMSDFINGKLKTENEINLFASSESQSIKREFSEEAKAVFDSGRELWKYFHSKPMVNVNASYYDIREYFQGRNKKGRMNSSSEDEHYMELIGELRNKLNFLADKIKPKVYEYEFLKE